MLMLTIKEDEYVMLGEDIRVQFVEQMSCNYVRIGIDAPKSVNIARGKAYERVLQQETEKNATKLEEIENMKKRNALEKEKTKEKARQKSREKARRKAEEKELQKLGEQVG